MSLNPRVVSARPRSVTCFHLVSPAIHQVHVCRIIFRIICGVLLIALAPVGYSQTKAPLMIEDSLKMRIFGEYSPPSISPDSRMVAFVARPAARNSFDMDRVART